LIEPITLIVARQPHNYLTILFHAGQCDLTCFLARLFKRML